MSLNSLKYDNCAYTHTLNESISPGDYMISTPRPCDPCFVVTPGVNVDRFGASLCGNELIDVSSELLNITRKASDCPSKKYLPSEKPFCTATNFRECQFLTPEDTLISNPKCTGKETTVNRWEWLCRNPVDHAIRPFDWFIANRTIVKDSHRPCLNTPLSQDVALPPVQKSSCASYMDEQFKEGEWKKTLLNNQPTQGFGSVFATTCQNVKRL
jgi:hypothetical protein